MLEPIYSLSLSRTEDGHFAKSAPNFSNGVLDFATILADDWVR
ncbi:MAG TPA: hypothetical protein VFE47_25670 [Tepidisphaeraceae bacterium]|nr:hypothetical protein [Tepidisphaeraceae bacterium]